LKKLNLQNSRAKKCQAQNPKNNRIPVSEAKTKEKPQEPKSQIFFSETESSDASEREYDVSLKWRTKKKSPRKKEGALDKFSSQKT
jgi:hypothetical protein